MAVGIGEETPYFLDAEASGMVRRTVRKVRETRRNPSDAAEGSLPTLIRDGGFEERAVSTGENNRTVRDASIAHGGDQFYALRKLTSNYPGISFPVTLQQGHVFRLTYWVQIPTTAPGPTETYSRFNLTPRVERRQMIPNDGKWHEIVLDAATDETYLDGETTIWIECVGKAGDATAWTYIDDVSVMDLGPFFDGDTPNAGGWEYRWEGQPNNSTSIAERVEYVDNYGTAEDGAPRVNLTVYNVPNDTELEIRWEAAGERGIVQGLKSWRVSGVGLAIDWAAPLNRETTYTAYVGGDPQASVTVTVHADQSWIQDPLHPDTALPVKRRGLDTGHLTLDQEAAKTGAYGAENTQTRVLGSKYPRFSGSMRSAASDLNLTLYTPDIPTTDSFAQMLEDTPILLFRPHERMRPFSLVSYLAADVVETPIDQDDPGHQDGGFTQWAITGNLVQAVMQAVLSGYITYGEVQDLLGGYTYGEVQSAAASTTYLDWQRNPLIFTYL